MMFLNKYVYIPYIYIINKGNVALADGGAFLFSTRSILVYDPNGRAAGWNNSWNQGDNSFLAVNLIDDYIPMIFQENPTFSMIDSLLGAELFSSKLWYT